MKRVVLWGFALGTLLVSLAIHQPAWCQQISAAITGEVVDAAGAALNGATVTVTDTVTGAVKTYTNPPGTLGSIADTAAF